MRSQKGFTLVEVIVGVALMSVVGIGLLTALTGASTVLLKADAQETARDLAQAQMEYMQSTGYRSDCAYLPKDTDADGVDDIDKEYPGFTSSITAAPVSGETDLQEITISVAHGSEEKYVLVGRKVNW